MKPLAPALLLGALLCAPPVLANGRLPGATALSIGGADAAAKFWVVRATFGLVESFDNGQSWQWICENAVQVSGEIDPPMAVTAAGTLVLLPPAGGALVSRDRGCTWSRAPAPLAEARSLDLTIDPANPARVLIVTSTVSEIDERGVPTYANALFETLDEGTTFRNVASLPSNFSAETLEIAPSDPQRVYVSGTANDNPLLGVFLSTSDGGRSWARSTIALPEGSGSVFISGIHPEDANRVWVRVPARDDIFGARPALLLLSTDAGAQFSQLARTEYGMFGFALSPDGRELAYGGPFDGLYVGASDGSTGFRKQSALGVRCLEWDTTGLYTCASEPQDPFSIGRSRDRGASFEPIYRMAQTCPALCTDASQFAAACRGPWQTIAPAIGVSGAECQTQWLDGGARPPQDAGSDAGSGPSSRGSGDGCGCSTVGGSAFGAALPLLALLTAALRRGLRSRADSDVSS